MLLNQMKASPPQFHNVRVQILQCCEVVGMLPQFCGGKRTHMWQNLEQAELPDSVVADLKVQSAFPLLMMSEKEMLFLLYMRLSPN